MINAHRKQKDWKFCLFGVVLFRLCCIFHPNVLRVDVIAERNTCELKCNKFLHTQFSSATDQWSPKFRPGIRLNIKRVRKNKNLAYDL